MTLSESLCTQTNDYLLTPNTHSNTSYRLSEHHSTMLKMFPLEQRGKKKKRTHIKELLKTCLQYQQGIDLVEEQRKGPETAKRKEMQQQHCCYICGFGPNPCAHEAQLHTIRQKPYYP